MISRGVLPALGLYGGFVGHNYYQQQQVLSGNVTPTPGTRLHAVDATKNFNAGTVGYGVHPSIRLIHALLGGAGQAQIGDLFAGPEAQETMATPNTWKNNLNMAKLEHHYWWETLKGMKSPGDIFGGMLGSVVPPKPRVGVQMAANFLRENAPGK